VKATGTRPKIIVSADGRGVVGHAGARLLADLAEATGLARAFGDALARLRQRAGGHEPGRIAVDVAVMLADGGEAISDLAVLRDQAMLFGPVASDSTAWRLLSSLDSRMLDRLAEGRARARETVWAQRLDTRGSLPATMAAGQPVPGLVLDMDARSSSATPTRNPRPRRGSPRSATTLCSASWTTPAKPCPACCVKGGPGPTPPPTTSPSSTRPSRRSRTPTGTAPRSDPVGLGRLH